jgi:hypothetical protein
MINQGYEPGFDMTFVPFSAEESGFGCPKAAIRISPAIRNDEFPHGMERASKFSENPK